MESFSEVFENVKKFCLSDSGVSEIGYNKWIRPLRPLKLENGTAYLTASSEFIRRTSMEVYEDILKRGFEEILGFPVEINISVEDEQEKEERIHEILTDHSEDKRMVQKSELTFDNFIKGKSTELAYAFCCAVAGKTETHPAQTRDVFNPLFIYGDSGLGKTHLLKAIEYEVTKKNKEAKVIYTTGENFTNELIKAIGSNNRASFHEKYRGVDFLLMDDVQFIAGKDSTQEEFFHTFNELYNRGKQIVLTSDIQPSKIAKLENRIKSRFVLGVQVDVQPPDFETRMAIVKRKAEKLDLNLSDPVARIIAEKLKINIRQLEGAVNKMKALTIYTSETPSISMAQRVIKEILNSQQAEITVDRILNDVANAFNVSPEEIRSANRNAPVSLARKIAIYLFREIKNMTYIEIGKELNRNHSTMTTSYQDITVLLKKNTDLKETVDDIMKNLKEN